MHSIGLYYASLLRTLELTTRVFLARRIPAELLALRCIQTIKPNLLATHLETARDHSIKMWWSACLHVSFRTSRIQIGIMSSLTPKFWAIKPQMCGHWNGGKLDRSCAVQRHYCHPTTSTSPRLVLHAELDSVMDQCPNYRPQRRVYETAQAQI